MKPFKYVSIIFVLISTSLIAQNINVSGNAFLDEQSDHSAIKVKLLAISPSAITDSTYTNSDGSYSSAIAIGIYNIEFSKEGYISHSLSNFFFSSDTTLTDVMLQYGTVVEIAGTILGTLTNEHVYRVIGDLTVPDTSSLIINPGVKMMFAGNYNLFCYGPITAIGTEQDPIYFTSAQPSPAPGNWGRVYLNYNDQDSTTYANQFSYCVFEYGQGENSWEQGGQLDVYYSDAFIQYSSFRNSGRGDLSLRYSMGDISKSRFSGGNSSFANVNFYQSVGQYQLCEINDFDHAMRINGGEVSIYNGTFSDGNNWALYIDSWAKVIVDSCLFYDIKNDWTIQIHDNSLVDFENNFLDNVHSWNAFGVWSSAHVDIINNKFDGLVYYSGYNSNSQNQTYPPEISGNIIRRNPQNCCYNGLQIEYNERLINVHHNTIYGFTGGHRGIYVYDNDSLSIHSNIVYGNDYGIYSYNSGYMNYSYNCFYANSNLTQENDFPQGFGQVIATNANGDPSDIYSNIFLNPQFENVTDFELQITSPCVNAGSPAYTDDDGTISDIGAKPYFFPFLIEHTPLNSTNDTNGPYTVTAEIKPTQNQSTTNTLYYRTTPDGFFAGSRENTALEFSGNNSGDRVEIPYNDEYNFINTITVEAWIKPSSTGHAYILSNRGDNGTEGFLLTYDDWDRRIRWHIWTSNSSNSWDGSTRLNANQWYHVAAIYDGYRARLYINGVLDGNWDWQSSGTINNSYDGITIGYRRHHAQEWNGIIDEVRIWNTLRTSANINNNMHRELYGNEPGLIGNWRFNEGSGTTAIDQSNNHNDGNIVGATYTTDASSLLPAVEYNEADWTSAAMNNTTGDNYSADIPGQSLNTTIDYYIQVMDGSDTLTSPYYVPYEFHRFNVSLFESTVSFSATSQNDGSIDLVWGTPTVFDGSLSGYNLYFDTASNVEISSANLLASLGTDQNSYTHTNLTEGTTYYYKITGVIDDENDTEGMIANEISAMSDNSTLMLAYGIVQVENATNHSGVKILFTPETATGSLDSVFSNSSGNFSIILPVAIYSVDITKDGCVPVHIPSLFFSGNYDFGIIQLLIRQIQELSGSISDTLTSDIYYIVTGNLSISSNDTLWIEPGTYIAFDGYYRIDANGPIFANGVEEDSIYFTSNAFQQSPGDWEYIRLMDNAGGSRFNYCVFEYGDGYNEWFASGVLRSEVSNVLISHCRFSYNQRGAISFYGSNCSNNIVQKSIFSFNWYNVETDGGIINIRNWSAGGTLQILNNKFFQNYGRDIDVYECYNGLTISNNTFESDNNYDNAAIRTHFTRPLLIIDNIFSGKSYVQIQHESYGIIENNSIQHNTHYTHGIYVNQSCMTIVSNRIQNCRSGIYYQNNKDFSDNSLYPHKICYNTIIDPYESGAEIGNNSRNIEISNNTIINADRDNNNGADGAAIYIRTNTADVTIHSNVITDSRYACYLNNTGDVSFYNNNFWNNENRFSGSGYPTGLGTVSSQNQNGDPSDIYSNIFLNPEFFNPESSDYSLLATSPLIDAGYILYNDPDGTKLDIGAHYFDHGNPHNLSVIDEDEQQIILQCSSVDRDSLTGYNVYSKLATNTDYTFNQSVTDSVATVTSLTNNIDYNFVVTSVYPNSESIYSVKAKGRPGLAEISINPSYLIQSAASIDTTVFNYSILNSGSKDITFELADRTTTFTKVDYSDWTLPKNQDHITNDVWITRANSNGLFNAATQGGWNGCGPEGTEWAWGPTKQTNPSDYKCWRNAVYDSPYGGPKYALVGDHVMSMHLIEEDIYFDIIWHSWTSNNNGGGFSYTRCDLLVSEEKFDVVSGSVPPSGSVDITFRIPPINADVYTTFVPYASNDKTNPNIEIPFLLMVDYNFVPAVQFTPATETGDPFYIVINNAYIDGDDLQSGDEIAMFDGDICVGSAMFAGEFPFVVKAYGYTSGDTYTLRAWDHSQYRYASTEAFDYKVGNRTFIANGFDECNIRATVFVAQDIAITSNQFNLISLNHYPQNPDASAVFSGIEGLKIVYDDHGGAFIPDYDVNTIGNVDIAEGYYLFFDSTGAQLSYSGLPINVEDWQLTFHVNRWNYFSYLKEQSADVTVLFDDVADSIDIIQADDGGSWIPSLNINTLGNLTPGEGYTIFLTSVNDLTFTYPSGQKSIAKLATKTMQPEYFVVEPTGLPYTIVIAHPSFEGRNLDSGDEIGVFDGELCVGAGTYIPDNPLIITAWEGYEDMDIIGFKEGNPIFFRLYSSKYKLEYPLIAEFRTDIEGVFKGSSYSLAKRVCTNGEIIPDSYTLGHNYPNPFNPTTIIPYQLPEDTHTRITIYNLLGQEVRVLVDEFQLAAYHSAIWNGNDKFGKAVPSGVYLYRIDTPNFHKSSKLLLIK
ncbi:MAG: right-handed parallel beta-helix repeat-containing protein [Candidatus Marinimicrobia bacterium]|nr:right-handed parallel beta-helix repeat-containing protein [Candidatus Neomarinimicrobiota bacterium]